MGYLWDEEKTKELIDDQGWVHSGDLGRIDDDGFVFMSGRMKEIIITGKETEKRSLTALCPSNATNNYNS